MDEDVTATAEYMYCEGSSSGRVVFHQAQDVLHSLRLALEHAGFRFEVDEEGAPVASDGSWESINKPVASFTPGNDGHAVLHFCATRSDEAEKLRTTVARHCRMVAEGEDQVEV